MHGREIVLSIVLSCSAFGQHGSNTVVNPYTGPEDVAAGVKLFRAQCAGCHGPDGAGTGAGPSLASGTFRRGNSDEALFQVISKGVPGTTMPGFSFGGLQIWQLVTYVRTTAITHGTGQVKGDSQAGAALFRSSCSGCHSVRGEGGLSGPDLTDIGSQRSVVELRSALLEPDKEVAPEYWTVSIQTRAGQKLRGIRLNEDTSSIQIRDNDGRLISVLKRDVAESELTRRSPMPSLGGKLSATEVDNLLAYLTRLREAR